MQEIFQQSPKGLIALKLRLQTEMTFANRKVDAKAVETLLVGNSAGATDVVQKQQIFEQCTDAAGNANLALSTANSNIKMFQT